MVDVAGWRRSALGGVMSDNPKQRGRESVGHARPAPIPHRRVDWPHVGLFIAALSGQWALGGVAVWAGEPSSRVVQIYTALLVLLVLGAFGFAIERLISAPTSRLHLVFRGRHLLAVGIGLLLSTAVLFSVVARDGLFDHLFASGRIDARDIADGGFGIAMVVCAVGTFAALIDAFEVIHAERHWYRSLGIGPW